MNQVSYTQISQFDDKIYIKQSYINHSRSHSCHSLH